MKVECLFLDVYLSLGSLRIRFINSLSKVNMKKMTSYFIVTSHFCKFCFLETELSIKSSNIQIPDLYASESIGYRLNKEKVENPEITEKADELFP